MSVVFRPAGRKTTDMKSAPLPQAKGSFCVRPNLKAQDNHVEENIQLG
jgi:hypothetical protein